MQYQKNVKIVIDKRKLDTLIRLGCSKEIISDCIIENKIIKTGDLLIDEYLETLVDIKEFSNWGGKREKKKQVENQVESQVESQVENQVDINLDDKDKDIDKDIDIDNNKDKDNKPITESKILNKEKYKIFNQAYIKLYKVDCILKPDQIQTLNAICEIDGFEDSIFNVLKYFRDDYKWQNGQKPPFAWLVKNVQNFYDVKNAYEYANPKVSEYNAFASL